VGSSARLVVKRGGISKLTTDERKGLKVRYVKPGHKCDDLPKESVNEQIRIGRMERRAEGASVVRTVTERGLEVRLRLNKVTKKVVKKAAKKR
jgi:hypothetical protein